MGRTWRFFARLLALPPLLLLIAAAAGCASSEAVEVTKDVDPPVVPVHHLGKVDSTLDSGRKAKAEYTGAETTLKLTDAGGSTWTLTIPSGALADPDTITMTALSKLSSKDIGGVITGGVRLEPDGLRFYKPAILSVKGPASSVKSMLLTGKQDGSEMDPAIPVDAKVDTSAEIYHFSTVVQVADEEKLGQEAAAALERQQQERFKDLGDRIAKENKWAVDDARKFLKGQKGKQITVPGPPPQAVACSERGVYNTEVAEWFDVASYPEYGLLHRLLVAKRKVQLTQDNQGDVGYLEEQLALRLVKKAQALLEETKGQPDKLLPVSTFALQAARQAELTGVDDKPLLRMLGPWAKASLTPMARDAEKKHDYAEAVSLLELARWIELWSSDSMFEDVAKRMEKLLTFEMQIKYFQVVTNVDGGSPEEWKLEATLPVKYLLDDAKGRFYLTASGTGKYVSYVHKDPNPMWMDSLPSFPVQMKILTFDACTGRATVLIDRFYAETESFRGKNDHGVPAVIPMTKQGWQILYGNGTAGPYRFDVKLNNLSENAIDETIDTQMGSYAAKLEIKMVHKP